MKNKTCYALLFSIVFCATSFKVYGQATVIKLANETIQLNAWDTVLTHAGNEMSGELWYRSRYDSIEIVYEGGYRKRENVYTTNHQPVEELHYEKGKLHGSYTKWNKFGKLETTGQYDRGMESGVWTYYYFNGEKECEGAFMADSTKLIQGFSIGRTTVDMIGISFDLTYHSSYHSPPHGEWYFFGRNGERIKTLVFEYGLLKGIQMATEAE